MDLLRSLSDGYAKINVATRTGAIDVVFVEQGDGTFASTPFHVRFGKLGCMWSGSKVVNLEINDAEVELTMVLDDNGMAHFSDGENNEEEMGDMEVKEEVHEEVKEQIASRRRDMMRKLKRQRSMSSGDMSIVELRDLMQKSEMPQLSASHRATSDGDLTEKEVVFDHQDEQGKVEEKVERNTLRLNKEEMEEVGLRLGGNSVVFSVTTRFQGTYRASCHVYVWQQKDKIVISDIDGTITRSDVRGMILPLIGAGSWAQEEVVRLYNLIVANGYKILYLSARSISQAADTKGYLEHLAQDGLSLPPGPLFLNPASLLQAGRLEVIEKTPELFKIECLTKLQELYSRPTPYFAGYGNRPNDSIAYKAVGIPISRIFLINKLGVLSGQVALNQQSSYSGHCSLVSLLFPPISIQSSEQVNFCVEPLPLIHPDDPLIQNKDM